MLGSGFFEEFDLGMLGGLEMTAWIDTNANGLVALDIALAGAPEVFGHLGLDVAPGAVVTVRLELELTRLDDPGIRIEPPIG